jgi:sporulation protein YlmC with PRC-barrel domain
LIFGNSRGGRAVPGNPSEASRPIISQDAWFRQLNVWYRTEGAPPELCIAHHVPVQEEFSHPLHTKGDASMARLAYTSILIALVTTCAGAQAQQQRGGSAAQIMSSIPGNSETITHWYKQNVYDPQDNKIGEIMDVLVDRDGKATALIIGVGGFLGAGEKDVAVPFNAVQVTNKNNNKWYLVMNSTKDALKNAKGFKYDRSEMKWIPE